MSNRSPLANRLIKFWLPTAILFFGIRQWEYKAFFRQLHILCVRKLGDSVAF